MNQSLHLSEESSENEEPKTKSASLAHRDSTIPDHDLDASYHDQDDDAFNISETEDSSPIKKGRGKEKEYDQIEKYPDSFFEVDASHWSNYDDFLAFHLKEFRYVTVNEQNWKLSVCSCWYWCKY